MNPAIKPKIIAQLSEMEALLFSLHRTTEGREHNELGYAYMSVREARQAVEGHLPADGIKPGTLPIEANK